MRIFCFSLSLVVVLQILIVGRAEAALRTVALTGQQAPGLPAGATYSLMSPPAIDSIGRTAFGALVSGGGVTSSSNTGIWSEGSGALTLLAREGNTAPGTALPYGDLQTVPLVMNHAGKTAFRARNTNNNANIGIFSDRTGGVGNVALLGGPAPSPTQEAHTFAFLGLPVIDDAGRVAFGGQISGQGVTTDNDVGVWSETTGGLQRAAREGDPAGLQDVHFNDLSPTLSAVSMNSSGQLAFQGYVTGGTFVDDAAIRIYTSGLPVAVATEDDPAPGTTGNFAALTNPAINNATQVAFLGSITGSSTNNDAVWTWGPQAGPVQLVAREGTAAPGAGAGVNFARSSLINVFLNPVINGAGKIAFQASLNGGGVTDSYGIFSGTPGNLTLLARESAAAPGVEAGVTFLSVGTPSINRLGQVIFYAALTGPNLTAANNEGVWAQDAGGTLRLVVREGQTVEVAPGDFRTIGGNSSVVVAGSSSGNQDGRLSFFNDSGLVAIKLGFTDGAVGMFIVDAVASAPLPGDYNGNGVVDAADYVVWRKTLIDGQQGYDTWRAHFGQSVTAAGTGSSLSPAVPEPTAIIVLIAALALTATRLPRYAAYAAHGIATCGSVLAVCLDLVNYEFLATVPCEIFL